MECTYENTKLPVKVLIACRYAIIAPEHLENDEITRRVYRIVNNKKAGGFEFNGYKLYTFEAVRNIGP